MRSFQQSPGILTSFRWNFFYIIFYKRSLIIAIFFEWWWHNPRMVSQFSRESIQWLSLRNQFCYTISLLMPLCVKVFWNQGTFPTVNSNNQLEYVFFKSLRCLRVSYMWQVWCIYFICSILRGTFRMYLLLG